MINPKQLVLNMMQQTRNPMIEKLIRTDSKSLEQFAINYCNERGIDFYKTLEEFKRRAR